MGCSFVRSAFSEVMRGSSPSTETALPDLISKDWECHRAAILLATCSSHRLSVWTHRILSVSVKSYRSESHMQSVSVSGMNYTAWDVLPYTRWASMFHILHAPLKYRNYVFTSFWATDNDSHDFPAVRPASTSETERWQRPRIHQRVCVCVSVVPVCVHLNVCKWIKQTKTIISFCSSCVMHIFRVHQRVFLHCLLVWNCVSTEKHAEGKITDSLFRSDFQGAWIYLNSKTLICCFCSEIQLSYLIFCCLYLSISAFTEINWPIIVVWQCFSF